MKKATGFSLNFRDKKFKKTDFGQILKLRFNCQSSLSLKQTKIIKKMSLQDSLWLKIELYLKAAKLCQFKLQKGFKGLLYTII